MNTERLSLEWLEDFLAEALPAVMTKCEEATPPVIADFVRLVELDLDEFPEPPQTPKVIWMDNIDEAPSEDEWTDDDECADDEAA
jgi:hypothetical protein